MATQELTRGTPGEPGIQPAHRVSKRPFYQEIVKDDVHPAPEVLMEYSEVDVPVPSVERERYTSKDFFRLEQERMWSRVWQMAGREEQLPEVGDTLLYESPGMKIFLVRTDEDTIKAYYNSCPHRGMKLCPNDTSLTQIRCPFHGFTWEIDGTMREVPAAWDFPQIEQASFALPEVRVERWQGFIFVNRDANARPLIDYLENLPVHFANWSRAEVELETIVRKVMPANWKACIEGFLEAFHVAETHWQAKPFSGDSSTKYDVWPGNETISRFVEPTGVQSDAMEELWDDARIFESMMQLTMGTDQVPQLPEGSNIREAVAGMIRGSFTGEEADYVATLSDAEVVDAVQYSIFPNIVLFRSLGYPFAYRFVPLADDPDNTTFDFMIFRRKQEGVPPPEVKVIELTRPDLYSECGAFPPWLGQIYDQDTEGFANQQDGLKSGSPVPVLFSQYQEVRLRHLHQTLMRYINDVPAA